MEALEPRLLFSMNPTGMEQEMLEMINRMRMNPQEELERIFLSTNPGDPNYFRTGDPDVDAALSYFGVNDGTLFSQWASLSPAAPLAWNEALIDAARNHSNRMILQDLQSHQLPADASLGLAAEPSLLNRAVNAGYTWSGSVSVGENVFAYAESIFHSHVAFAIDWGNTATGIQSPPGHRENIMDSTYREIGIGVLSDSNPSTSVGPLVVTQDFGARGNYGHPRLLGVIFSDADADGFYDAGEGRGGLTITIRNGTTTFQATTMAAGGYQIELAPGTYTITASGAGLTGNVTMGTVTIGSNNQKLDLDLATVPTLGAVGGTVFQDANQDGILGTAETGLAGFTVFADADRDGVLDASERFQVTNSSGTFLLPDLAPGEWSIRVVGQPEFRSTTPNVYSVSVAAGSTTDSAAFGQFRFLTTSGNTVTMVGTPGADQFDWQAGATNHSITLNGVSHQFAAATYRNFLFDGLAGIDAVSFRGGGNSDTVNFDGKQVSLTDGVYAVSASQVENSVVDAGAGTTQRAYFLDSAGDDTFMRNSVATTLTATQFSNRATGFDRTYATSSRGGQDRALLYDASGNDYFTGRDTYATLWAADNRFVTRVDGFKRVNAYSQAGNDIAYLYDSTANDILSARPTSVSLWAADLSFQNVADGFELTYAYATAGGTDQAYFYDAATNDTFVATVSCA